MSLGKMILIVFLTLLIAAILYGSIYYRKHKEDIIQHPLYHTWIKHEKLAINIYNDGYWLDGHNCKVRIEQHWTKQTKKQLTSTGYYKFVDFLHDWKYFGTKCYVQFWNLDPFDIAEWNRNHPKEEDKLNEMASYNLYDYYKSKVVERFMKGFSRLSLFNGMDSKTIGIIIVVAAGILLGLYFLLSGRI